MSTLSVHGENTGSDVGLQNISARIAFCVFPLIGRTSCGECLDNFSKDFTQGKKAYFCVTKEG